MLLDYVDDLNSLFMYNDRRDDMIAIKLDHESLGRSISIRWSVS